MENEDVLMDVGAIDREGERGDCARVARGEETMSHQGEAHFIHDRPRMTKALTDAGRGTKSD